MEKRGKGKLGQAWVETVIYTLIGLAIIGLVIGIATPKIKEMTDRALLEQTISAMSELDEKIVAAQTAVGTSREATLRIKKGEVNIDSTRDIIYFVLEDTNLKFSEPGANISLGDLIIRTEEVGKKYEISIILDYSRPPSPLNVTFNDQDFDEILSRAPVPYRLLMRYKENRQLDISLI